MTNPNATAIKADRSPAADEEKLSLLDRITTGDGGIDFIGRSKLWYAITGVLIAVSLLTILLRGFDLSIDFEGGTKLNMPAQQYSAEQVERIEDTFVEATGVTPELTQVVGSGDTATLEINSERLSEQQVQDARRAIYEEFQPRDAAGRATPDAVGASTVSESWGSTITKRMVLSLVAFLVLAFAYIALRLKPDMAAAAMLALLVDAIVIPGIYSIFGFEVSPAAVIGFLTVLTFSIYDTVIVFDKVRENVAGITGSRTTTYAEAANAAVNQTFMRSFSTSVISALPIVALLIVAVWMLGVGALQDLALIQLIGVIEGVFSSIFLATPMLVSIANRRKDIARHNAEVFAFRSGEVAESAPETPRRDRVAAMPAAHQEDQRSGGGKTWRPGV